MTGETQKGFPGNVGAATGDDTPFWPVSLRTLPPGSVPTFDLYVRWRDEYVLYRHAALEFDAPTRRTLLANNVESLYVAEDDLTALLAFHERHLRYVVTSKSVSIKERARVAIRVAEHLARDLLYEPSEANVERGRGLARVLASLVTDPGEGETAIAHLLGALECHPRLAIHSVNTAVFAAALGRYTTAVVVEDVAQLTLAGLLHDVGLTQIPAAILAKPGPLSTNERELVQSHPITGENILRQVATLPEPVLSAVRWHHERLDGSGYPDGLRGVSVCFAARAVAIAEVYDALTSDQPYRPRLKPFDALTVMLFEMSDGLDTGLLRKLIPLLLEAHDPDRVTTTRSGRATGVDVS